MTPPQIEIQWGIFIGCFFKPQLGNENTILFDGGLCLRFECWTTIVPYAVRFMTMLFIPTPRNVQRRLFLTMYWVFIEPLISLLVWSDQRQASTSVHYNRTSQPIQTIRQSGVQAESKLGFSQGVCLLGFKCILNAVVIISVPHSTFWGTTYVEHRIFHPF